MSDAVLTTIVSGILAGMFQLLSKRMDLHKSSAAAQNSPTPANPSTPSIPATPPASGSVNYSLVIKQIGILQFVLNIVGFCVGFLMVSTGANQETLLASALLVGTIALIALFFWAALSLDKSLLWKHLAVVALGVAITTLLVNSIILQMPISLASLGFALVQSFACMGIGGVIAQTMKR